MIWLSLSAVVLALGYALWIVYRGRRFFRNLLQASSPSDVLKGVLEQHHFYFTQGMGSLIALLVFLGIKTVALLFRSSEATVLNTVVFGSFTNRFLPGKLGCLGVVLLVISLGCFYQHLKSKHYLHVLYAFRNQLGLTETG
jgi:hypothetical protein